MNVQQILRDAVEKKVSDIFILAGLPVSYKTNDKVERVDERLTPAATEEFIRGIYALAGGRDITHLLEVGDEDFSFSIEGVSRFRASVYKQRGSLAAVLRVIYFMLPDAQALSIPESVLSLSTLEQGLVLVTGPAGSGKSTTLACVVDRINSERIAHIITLEDPLEYIHEHKESFVSQREISSDTESYTLALRAALRQSPDVILLGEMRDFDTISVAMTAAETGQLVLSTLHTVGAANTIDRIIDVFPPNQQHQIRVQLSMVLRAVVSQQLVPMVGGGVVPVFEIMFANTAIKNLIRENKVHQIDTAIHSGSAEGMISMDGSLVNLYKRGVISEQSALKYASNPDMMQKKLDFNT